MPKKISFKTYVKELKKRRKKKKNYKHGIRKEDTAAYYSQGSGNFQTDTDKTTMPTEGGGGGPG